MDQRTLAGFKARLEARLYELLDGQHGLAVYLADGKSTNDPMDSADLASFHCDYELTHLILHHNHKLVREVLAAIRRIENGEFGICDECSELIGLERLRVQPATVLCIRCKRDQEAGRRSNAA